MTDMLILASTIPNTGDNFPVVPIAIAGVLAIVIAVLTSILAKKKKK